MHSYFLTMCQTVYFDTSSLFCFLRLMMTCFTGIDASLVLMLRDNSHKLEIQIQHQESSLDPLLAFLCMNLMMQWHTAGLETAEPDVQLHLLLLIGGTVYKKGCNSSQLTWWGCRYPQPKADSLLSNLTYTCFLLNSMCSNTEPNQHKLCHCPNIYWLHLITVQNALCHSNVFCHIP